MKKSELKNIIKECVKEILFEEGALSNLVAEVAFGIAKMRSKEMLNKERGIAVKTDKVFMMPGIYPKIEMV